MGPSHRRDPPDSPPLDRELQEQTLRGQEAMRAYRELVAYFKGRRTEREARAALKTLKAFVRHRERAEPSKRVPLPVARSTKTSKRISDER